VERHRQRHVTLADRCAAAPPRGGDGVEFAVFLRQPAQQRDVFRARQLFVGQVVAFQRYAYCVGRAGQAGDKRGDQQAREDVAGQQEGNGVARAAQPCDGARQRQQRDEELRVAVEALDLAGLAPPFPRA